VSSTVSRQHGEARSPIFENLIDDASGLPLVRRILVATAWFAPVVALVLWSRAGGRFATGYLAAAALGAANLWAMKKLVACALTPGEIDRAAVIKSALIKFPVIYGTGILLVLSGWFPIVALAVGFSTVLLVIVLKVLGRAITGRSTPAFRGLQT
jgi:hypothetical protein